MLKLPRAFIFTPQGGWLEPFQARGIPVEGMVVRVFEGNSS